MERPHLLIIGVGGGGITVLENLPRIGGRRGIRVVAADTDAQTLKQSRIRTRIDLGKGKASKVLNDAFNTSDRLIIVVALGGKTGGPAAVALANQALRANKRVSLVALTPFPFEPQEHHERTLEALQLLQELPIMRTMFHGHELLNFVHQSQAAEEAWREIDLLLADTVAALAYSLQELGHDHSDIGQEHKEQRPWEDHE